MKILVVSDTHGDLEKMRLAADLENPDLILHLGDHDSDAMDLARERPDLDICYVCGNCDSPFGGAAKTFCRTCGGVKIFAAHGHTYGVKNSLLRFSYAAREQGAQVALFGHTHCPFCEMRDGLWLMNPGACKGWNPTYGLVEIEKGSVSCRVVEGAL